jgi:hypothetical protein
MNRDESIVSDLACWAVAAVFVFGLAVLALRLKEVQVEDAADYSYANARQSVRRVQTDGVRGRIIDRNGVVLADNRKSVSIVCKSAFFQKRTWEATVANIETALSNVAAAVGSPSPLTRRDIRRHIDQTLAMPLVAWRDVGEKELARFCEHDRELPGFSVLETEESINGGHGGGDEGIIRELYAYLSGSYTGYRAADIDVSVSNHLIGFAAEQARHQHTVVNIADFCRENGY